MEKTHMVSLNQPPTHLRLGLFGIGLDTYWPQFAGLKERLEGYLQRVARKLALPGVEVVNLGLIDTPEKALASGHQFRQAGKVGRGLSVEMSVKHGPVTLLSVVQTLEGRFKLLVAEAESVPGPILELGNTNSRCRFSIGARKFVEAWNVHGPAHHCAVGLGHLAGKIEKLGKLLGMDVVKVC
jgi:L-arabinose isomerase